MNQQSEKIDPRRPIIEVMARLGRETQLHLDERERHFKITDAVIIGISMILIVLAVFNVYYVRVLYGDLNHIVGTMESMHSSLGQVEQDMLVIADRVDNFDQHMQRLSSISEHVERISDQLPGIHANMQSMTSNMAQIDHDMGQLNQTMGGITPNMAQMSHNMDVMRHNIRQIAGPMGAMNPVMP